MTETDDRSPTQRKIDDLEAQLAKLRAEGEPRQEWTDKDHFQVTAPVVIMQIPGQGYRHLYMGAVVPRGVAAEAIEHHLNVSHQIAKIGSPEADAAFELARQEALGRGESPELVGAEGADRAAALADQAKLEAAHTQGMPPPTQHAAGEAARRSPAQSAGKTTGKG